MAAITIYSDFGAQKNKVSHGFHCFPIYLPWSGRTGCHDLSFWMLSFKPTFSLSSFIFIKTPFSSSSLSAIRVVSSAYLHGASEMLAQPVYAQTPQFHGLSDGLSAALPNCQQSQEPNKTVHWLPTSSVSLWHFQSAHATL